MSAPRHVLLAGATGLVGGGVLQRLLAEAPATVVVAPVRRGLAVRSDRLRAPVVDFAAPGRVPEDAVSAVAPNLDALVCCLGTTLKQAGSREAFLAVDRELVLRMAALARDLGARHAILVSSVGASAQSGNFYLRVKGEAERGIAELRFERLDVLRPGLLLGPRGERRSGEAIAQAAAPFTNLLMTGRLRRYRAIAATEVADAAVRLLSEHAPGQFVHEHDALRTLAAGG